MAEQADTRTIEQLAAEAMAIQSACNLCGLAQSFARSVSRLMRVLDEQGQGSTEQVNSHPIVVVWLDKFAQLADVQGHGDWRVTQAFARVAMLVKPSESAATLAPVDAAADTQPAAMAGAPSFDDALAAWLERSQARIDEEHARSGSAFAPRKLSLDPGGVRYVRVVVTDGPSRSALAFVERATGNIYKPDGWKRPAKGVRGNIYGDTRGVASTGELYAR